jgi:DNA-binding PadR family transcriptional regulator
MQEVERVTGGQMRLGPGTLYRSIYQLLEAKLIAPAEEGAPPADERRCVYRLLPRGLAVARAEAQRLANLVRVARSRGLLEGRAASRSQRRGAMS